MLKYHPLELVATRFPPEEASHQWIKPIVVTADKFVLLPQVTVEGKAVTEVGAGKGFTHTVSAILIELQG